MKLLDANVLVGAHNTSFAQHAQLKRWLERTLWEPEPVTVGWLSVLAFLRITTSPRVFPTPFSITRAVECVDAWFADGGVRVVEPTEAHWTVLGRLLSGSGARGNLVMDADLAALALEHDATLCSCDADFARFKGLRVLNPLDE